MSNESTEQQSQRPGQQERQANSIQVCLDRTPTFYSRIGRRLLHGSSDNKPTFDEVGFNFVFPSVDYVSYSL